MESEEALFAILVLAMDLAEAEEQVATLATVETEELELLVDFQHQDLVEVELEVVNLYLVIDLLAVVELVSWDKEAMELQTLLLVEVVEQTQVLVEVEVMDQVEVQVVAVQESLLLDTNFKINMYLLVIKINI